MKGFLQSSIVIIPFLLTGCAFHELSVDRHGKQLAPTLGVDESQIQFVSYCDFGFVRPLQDGFRAQKGVVAVTDSDLFFMTRHQRYLFSKDVSSIPIRHINGISILGSQIQLKYNGWLMVVQLDKASSQERTQQKYDRLNQALVALGVVEFESTKSYVRTGYIQTSRRSGGGGTNLGSNDPNDRQSTGLGSPFPIGPNGRNY